MNSFFAAIADFGGSDEDRRQRVDNSLQFLLNNLRETEKGTDPLGLGTYQRVVENFPVRKINVGVATRKLIKNVFYEYFRSEGAGSLEELWRKEAP
ncbi:MAG: hypothetical protein K8L99_16920 [Anaerolineae bacterium]|nr:hypothetical protein [Anaerolineae bacterium]